MILNAATKQAMTQSSHPHDNWMGEGWLVVPEELETTAYSLSPFIILELDEDGEIADLTDDAEARAAFLAAQAAENDEAEAQ